MDRTRIVRLAVAALAACLCGAPVTAAAADDEDLSQQDRVSELERKVELLTEELARTRQDMGVPEEKELESVWGLGPAASKVYGIGRGLSIGGYAEAIYTNVIADKRRSGDVDRFDALRAVLYTGYKFTDHIVFNAEFEFEHATTSSTESAGSGSVSVEFMTLDFLLQDEVNARAGLLLVPMGFVNEMHEPPFFYGANRPDVERVIIPTTWRENGAGLFGRIGDMVEYKLYAITAPNAAGFDASGLRGGRQNGNRALAEDMAFVGRVDFEPIPELLLGGSVLVGETGQDQRLSVLTALQPPPTVKLPDARLALWEAHAQLQTHGLHARALVAMAHLDDAAPLTLALRQTGDIGATEVVADEMFGVYGEVAYEVMQWIHPASGWTVEPFFRFEHVDTQHDMPSGFARNRARTFEVYTAGLQVKPIPNVVLKVDYRNRQAHSGALGDEVNLGMGLVF